MENWDIVPRGRNEYAEKHNVPLKISRDQLFRGEYLAPSHEGLDLEDPLTSQHNKEGFLEMCVSPERPDKPEYITIGFEKAFLSAQRRDCHPLS